MRLLEQAAEPQNARAWLYAAVRNHCIDILRRKQPTINSTSTDVYLEGLSDEEAQERSINEAALWETIDQLPNRQREVLLMAKRDGHTYAEIASLLGIRKDTSASQLHKAKKMMAKMIKKYNDDNSYDNG